ncbi:MAG: hypothetical protein ACR652_00565 [Methylocystis sp.]|uniref:hypothetical protein n=1 Tax=Methylocystis sp. TaxID=1911079 RepID=UPI003DA3BA9F
MGDIETEKQGFKFNLRQSVALTQSAEAGVVVGRVEYTYSDNNYLIRYRSADGRQVQDWWPEDAITAAN